MTDREVKLVLGGLLHDIGKVIYRQGDDRRKHSQSGYDFLKDEVQTGVCDTDILDCVRYHHADAIKSAAHTIVSVTEEWIKRETKKTPQEIMGNLKYLIVKSGINVKESDWKSYDNMNDRIKKYLQ